MSRLSVLPLAVVLHGPLGYCTASGEEGRLFAAAGLGVNTRLTPELLGMEPAQAQAQPAELGVGMEPSPHAPPEQALAEHQPAEDASELPDDRGFDKS